MYGYDDHTAYLVDTDQQGGAVSTSLTSLAEARAARGPMTARHRSFTLKAPTELPAVLDRIVPAITACADAFLNPPIANLGHRGIEKAGELIRTWLERTDDPQRDLPQAALLMEKAGTGGALCSATSTATSSTNAPTCSAAATCAPDTICTPRPPYCGPKSQP